MGTTYIDGNITTDGTEQNLFNLSTAAHYSFYLFTDHMASGDKITIRVYVWDSEDGVFKKMETIILENAQTPDEAWFYSFLPSQQYKVSIQRNAGTDRNYTWQRIEVT